MDHVSSVYCSSSFRASFRHCAENIFGAAMEILGLARRSWIHPGARAGPLGRWGSERRIASSELMRSVTLIRDLARPRVFHLRIPTDAVHPGESE